MVAESLEAGGPVSRYSAVEVVVVVVVVVVRRAVGALDREPPT